MNLEFSKNISTLKGSAIREIFKFAGSPQVISLAGGNPSAELFPGRELAQIAADILTQSPTLALQYGVTEGYDVLREQIRERLAQKEYINMAQNDVLITSGGQQTLDLATKIFINDGDAIIVEQPSFIGALNCFRSHGARLVGIPVQADGMDMECLERAIKENKKVKMIYTIPTFQNPSGITMSQKKREELYRIAQKYDLLILEDNPYGELSFDGTHHQTIKSMDTDGRVIYSGSFSKILAPGIRVGYMCAAAPITQKAAVAKQTSDVHTPMLTQLLVSEYMKRYDLEALIAKMRLLYKEKCDTMLHAMEKYFPKTAHYTTPSGGLFIWVTLPEQYDTLVLSKQCAQNNVVFVPGNTFMVDMEQKSSSLRLNYSSMPNERITQGIKILGDIFKTL